MNNDINDCGNVGNDDEEYPEEWLRADDLVIAAIAVVSILCVFWGLI